MRKSGGKMITLETVMSVSKEDLPEAAKRIDSADIMQLVEWLALKDDSVRYPAFLLLQCRSSLSDDVYPYWDLFVDKLKSDNSYQRSIGLMLIAENARWDTQNKTEDMINDYLQLIYDEKPITIRQCIQSLVKIVTYKPSLGAVIAEKMLSYDLMSVKETMRKSILLDILNLLCIIRKTLHSDQMEALS
jgi:hypothetical protein